MGFVRASKSLRGAQGVLLILIVFAGVCIRLGWVAWVPMTPTSAFILFFFGIALVMTVFWLCFEANRSYRKSLKKWYEGRSQIIPEVICTFILKDKVYRANVTRIDFEGIFLWVPGVYIELNRQNRSCLVQLNLTINNQNKIYNGHLMTLVSMPNQRGYGVGVRFIMPQDDLKKEFVDFIEDLRGYGYL